MSGKGFNDADPALSIPREKFCPFIDKYGQYMHRNWKNKILTDADLKTRLAEEQNFEKKLGAIPDRDKYFGLLDPDRKYRRRPDTSARRKSTGQGVAHHPRRQSVLVARHRLRGAQPPPRLSQTARNISPTSPTKNTKRRRTGRACLKANSRPTISTCATSTKNTAMPPRTTTPLRRAACARGASTLTARGQDPNFWKTRKFRSRCSQAQKLPRNSNRRKSSTRTGSQCPTTSTKISKGSRSRPWRNRRG